MQYAKPYIWVTCTVRGLCFSHYHLRPFWLVAANWATRRSPQQLGRERLPGEIMSTVYCEHDIPVLLRGMQDTAVGHSGDGQ